MQVSKEKNKMTREAFRKLSSKTRVASMPVGILSRALL
jgi:hypothetical protein